MAVEPNLFELEGEDTKINYSAGVSKLSYQTKDRSLNFSGEKIHLLETEIGTMVTVTIEIAPDGWTLTLTLLLPTVNLPEEATERPIETRAILTTHLTSIGGPSMVDGQVQTYRTLTLKGTASLVAS